MSETAKNTDFQAIRAGSSAVEQRLYTATVAAREPAKQGVSERADAVCQMCAGADAARFWSKVARGTESECWLWLGGKRRKGYGGFCLDGTTVSAHRMAWELANRLELPAGAILRAIRA